MVIAKVTFEGEEQMAAKTKIIKVCGRRNNTGSPQSWWVDTGILVNAGHQLIIDASNPVSSITTWPGSTNWTPIGKVSETTWHETLAYRTSQLETASFSLIGKIGRDGSAFAIGQGLTFTAPASGTLFLACNDGVSFQDNSGYWNVSVTFEENVRLPSYGSTSQYGYGTSTIFADRVDTSLVDGWGIILTVQSDTTDANAVWTVTAKNNLISAFLAIQNRLLARTSRRFKDVFGGVELRFTQTLPPAPNGQIPAGQTFNLNVVRFSNVTRSVSTSRVNNRGWGRLDSGYYTAAPGSQYGFFIVDDRGIQNTVIHELGHVFVFRADEMRTTAGSFGLKVVKDVNSQVVDSTLDVGKLWENTNNEIGEIVPDNFLNWVRNSYVGIANIDDYSSANATEEQRASAYWVGGITFNSQTSTGISGFATSAKTVGDAASATNSVLRKLGTGETDPNCVS